MIVQIAHKWILRYNTLMWMRILRLNNVEIVSLTLFKRHISTWCTKCSVGRIHFTRSEGGLAPIEN